MNKSYNQRGSALVKSLLSWETMDEQGRDEWLLQCSDFLAKGLAQPKTELSAFTWYLRIVEVCLYKHIALPVVALHNTVHESVINPAPFLMKLRPEYQTIWLIAQAMVIGYNEGYENGMNLAETLPPPIQEDGLPEVHPN